MEIRQSFPQVMLMDATYKTNKYKMPLLKVLNITSTQLTFCIAFIFVHEEKEFNYTWTLSCLKSIMSGSLCPQVIVTEKELALMKACHTVFPNSKQLLCGWHINQGVWKKARQSILREDYRNSFYTGWKSLVLSQIEEAYNFNLTQLQTILFKYSESDLWKYSPIVHNIVESQVTAIKASFEYNKGRINHWVNAKLFELLWNCISLEALDMIINEFERCKSGDVICGCQLRTCYGLPCAHELITYFNARKSLPLDSIDSFGEKLLCHRP
uniref:MULE transposase domain-containing protein n=1 Tax=Lactuca sativa TaxID=4236 RepID=A0A9R1WIG3_LACSA|nr:hypothetical protein LSAT_V11C200064460 [Lactuca sativa]